MKNGDKVQIKKEKESTVFEIIGAAGEYVSVKNYLGEKFTFHESDLKLYRDLPIAEDYPNKIEMHGEICEKLNETYEKKNNDYGDSFAKLRNELPNAILVRIYDKYSRLKTLMNGADQKVKDESIDDSLMDLANYCIMELVERKMDNE